MSDEKKEATPMPSEAPRFKRGDRIGHQKVFGFGRVMLVAGAYATVRWDASGKGFISIEPLHTIYPVAEEITPLSPPLPSETATDGPSDALQTCDHCVTPAKYKTADGVWLCGGARCANAYRESASPAAAPSSGVTLRDAATELVAQALDEFDVCRICKGKDGGHKGHEDNCAVLDVKRALDALPKGGAT